MGFKTTFSWNGNTSPSCCCTTCVWNVKKLLGVYIHPGMWKPSRCSSCCCGSVGKPPCTHTLQDIVQSLQRSKRDRATERPACRRRCAPPRPVVSGESSSFAVRPRLEKVPVGPRPPGIHLSHPASAAAKSSMEKPALWSCGQRRRGGETQMICRATIMETDDPPAGTGAATQAALARVRLIRPL